MARRENIPALTGVRGLAAVGVMAFHYWNQWVAHDTIASAAAARGYIFVDLFFLLSGFVMASSYGRRFADRFGAVDYMQFIAIRLARIYPVYAVVFAISVAVAIVHPAYSPETDAGSLLANATLTQAWWRIPSTIGPAWSLSTEWAVYLVFPLFVSALLTSRSRTALAVCIAAAAALLAIWSYNVAIGRAAAYGIQSTDWPTPMVRCFAGFALGVGVFRFKDDPRVAFASSDAVGAAILLLTVGLWLIPARPDIALYPCLPALLLCLALNRGRLATLFGNRAMHALGEWSYSFYLIHMLFIHGRRSLYDLLAARLPSPVADAVDFVALFSIVLLFSAALYTLIEVPARRKLRSMIGARRLPAELEPSAP